MFDPSCCAYWCDSCGKEMTLDYQNSNETIIQLVCKNGHHSRPYFKAQLESEMEDAPNV